MKSPIFIVGASRSGTTMLRLMLNAHTRLGVPHELKYFNSLPIKVDWKQWRDPALTEAQYERLVRGFLQQRKHVFSDIGVEQVEQEILGRERRDLREPYRVAAEAWVRHYGKARWGEKTPHNLYYVDILYEMFPAARFIYIVRDPRAVVSSMNNIEYFSRDTVLNAFNWYQAVTDGYELLRTSVPEAQRMTVRYEDLVCDPEQQTRAICAFIGEAFEPGMLEFHRDSSRYMGPVIRTPSVTQPVSRANTEKWKHTLSPAEVALIESICAAEMIRFQYEPTGGRLDLQSRLDKLVKSAYWRWKSRKRRHVRGYTVHYPMFGRTRRRLVHLFRPAS